MKKFWTILTVALVALGAVACSNNFEDEVVAPVEGISFTAAIDQTRTALEKDGDIYKTVWVGDETIIVSAEDASFEFKNSTAATSTFTCAEAGAAELLGKAVTLTYNKVIDSAKGAAGLTLAGESDAFATESNITLTVGNAFLKFTSEADVTFTASEAIFGNGEALATTATVEAGEDVLVAVMAADACTLSFAINGVTCNSTTLDIVNNKIYNLGTLEVAPVAPYHILGDFNSWNTETAIKMIEKNGHYIAKSVTFAEDTNFKFAGLSWVGSTAKYTINKWAATDSNNNNNISIVAGTYDIYLQPNTKAFMVAESGTKVDPFIMGITGKIASKGINWDADLAMTLEGDFYVYKNLTLAATDAFKIRVNKDWVENYGLDGTEPVSVAIDDTNVLVMGAKNMKAAAGTYDLYFNPITLEFYVLTDGKTPADLDVVQYKVYIHNANDWDAYYLHAWTEGGAGYTGGWPGAELKETETVQGFEYFVYTMPVTANDQQVQFIVNNNNNGKQTSNSEVFTLNKNIYLLLNGTKLTEIADLSNPNPEPEVPLVARKVYVKNTLNWNPIKIYTWNETGNFAGGWSGTAMTQETINGTAYYSFTYDATNDGDTVNIIFNNGGSDQTVDITDVKLDKDHFFEVISAQTGGKYQCKEIADPRE